MQTAFVSIIPSKNCRHNVLVNWLSSVENITRLMYSQIKHTNCILCENGKKPLIGILIMYGERRAGGRRKWVRQFPMYFHSGCSCRKHNLDDTCIFHYIMWVEMGHLWWSWKRNFERFRNCFCMTMTLATRQQRLMPKLYKLGIPWNLDCNHSIKALFYQRIHLK